MRQDRFLIGILVGIGLLIALSLALYFTRQNQTAYVQDTNPDGVVQNYVLALQKKDYNRAYTYLADTPDKPDSARFQQMFSSGQMNLSGTSIEVGQVSLNGDHASVTAIVIRASGDLFSTINREPNVASLVKQNNGWKLTSMPYPFWGYDWYQPPVKTVPGQ